MTRLRIFILTMLPALPAYSQNNAKDVLLRLRQTVMNTVENLPKYVCTQTVDRASYDPDRRWYSRDSRRASACDNLIAEAKGPNWKRQLTSSDRLRLDVAVDRSKPGVETEMYSWAGEDQFSGRHLFEMVPEGALQTGTFSSLLTSIFGESTTFSYNGDLTLAGRLLSEFGFRVPLEKSHYGYVFKNKSMPGEIVGYEGTILVDPSNSRLVRLFMQATHLPDESLTCEVAHVIDYAEVNLHGTEFLLPAEARVSFLQIDGVESENVVHYSNCHEFQGQSRIRFEATPEGNPPPRKANELHSVSLPSGVPFRVIFEQQLDVSEAAAGDPIRASLGTAICDKSSRVLVPAGAEVVARIVGIKHFDGPSGSGGVGRQDISLREPSWIIKVKLEAVKVDSRFYPLHARVDDAINRFRKVSGSLGQRVEIGRLRWNGSVDEAAFEFFGPNLSDIVTKGLESNWRTR